MTVGQPLPRTSPVATQTVLFHATDLLVRQPLPPAGVQLRHREFGGSAVAGKLEIADIAWLQVLRMTAAAHRLVHKPVADATSVTAMWMQLRGTSVIEQQGRSARLVPGRWSLVSSQQPYTLLSSGHTQRIALLVPNEHIRPEPDLAQLSTRSFSGTAGIARIVFDAARSAIENVMESMPAADLAESVCRLASLAMQEGAARKEPQDDRVTLVDRIHSYIVDHLCDPDLSLETISRSLGVSKRSLHRAVHATGDSIHDIIWNKRLAGCHRDLLDPAKAHLGIGDIAHSWGFKNITHFSRLFRDHFGASARDTRRGRAEAAATRTR